MSERSAKYTARYGERMCRIDLDRGEIESEGIDKEKCKKLLRTLIDSND